MMMRDRPRSVGVGVHMSDMWQSGVVRKARPFNRGTLMLPIAQAMNILREPRPNRRVHAHRQPVFKVMPRPAPDSVVWGPWQPRRHEEPSRGLLVAGSGNMTTATRAPAPQTGNLGTLQWRHTYLNELPHWKLQTIPNHTSGRPIGPRLDARTNLAQNLHQLAHNKTSPVCARRVATCGWSGRATRRAWLAHLV